MRVQLTPRLRAAGAGRQSRAGPRAAIGLRWCGYGVGGLSMPEPASPRRMDATVAFDDTFVERWYRSPCVLCVTRPDQGTMCSGWSSRRALWRCFPCVSGAIGAPTNLSSWRLRCSAGCTRRKPVAPGAWTAWDETAEAVHRRNPPQTPHTSAALMRGAASTLPLGVPSRITPIKSIWGKLTEWRLSDPGRARDLVQPAAEALRGAGRRAAHAARARKDPSRASGGILKKYARPARLHHERVPGVLGCQ